MILHGTGHNNLTLASTAVKSNGRCVKSSWNMSHVTWIRFVDLLIPIDRLQTCRDIHIRIKPHWHISTINTYIYIYISSQRMDINLNDSVAWRRNCCSPWHAFVSPSMMTLDSQMAWCGTHKIPSHRGTLGWTGDLTTLLGRFHCVSQDHLNARSIDFRPRLLGIDAQVSEGAVLQDYCKIATILDRIRMHGTGTAKLEHCSPEHSMSKVDNFEKYRGLATATWYYHHVVKKKKLIVVSGALLANYLWNP